MQRLHGATAAGATGGERCSDPGLVAPACTVRAWDARGVRNTGTSVLQLPVVQGNETAVCGSSLVKCGRCKRLLNCCCAAVSYERAWSSRYLRVVGAHVPQTRLKSDRAARNTVPRSLCPASHGWPRTGLDLSRQPQTQKRASNVWRQPQEAEIYHRVCCSPSDTFGRSSVVD